VVRKSTLIGGIALAIFWGLGLAFDGPRAAGIIWFDALAAIVSLGTAALVDDSNEGVGRAFGPGVLALGLTALFVISAATHQPAWATWLNLLFALAYIGITAAALSPKLLAALPHRHSSGMAPVHARRWPPRIASHRR
jgi:hypothetical protein